MSTSISISEADLPLDALYGIGRVAESQPVAAGFSARNSLIRTGKGRYFLKRYRFGDLLRLQAAHAAKFYFAAAGVPAIKPLKNVQGASYFLYGEKYYALFPQVQAKQIGRGRFSPQALESAGAMLAQMHHIGRGQVLPALRASGRRLRLVEAEFGPRAQRLLELLKRQEKPNDFDRLAAEFIGLKLRLAADYREGDDPIHRLPFDHMVHGDYHDGNMFFSEGDRINWICDWEKVTVAPRAVELIRSMEFICFGDISDYVPVFGEQNFAAARRYLQAYTTAYAVPKDEFVAAYQAYYWGRIIELWVETEHYIEGNRRLDVFLRPRYTFVRYYAEHLEACIERIAAGILF
jgi:Ser/Thr protein kinase RdoA (MazF antagonist)